MSASSSAREQVAQIARALAWCAFLAGSHLGLMAAGSALPTPPIPWPPDELLQWVEANDAVIACFSVLRVIGLVIVWYLAALTTLTLLAQISGLRPLGWVAHRLALPWARALINHVLGAGLALTIAGGVVPIAGATMAMARPVAAAAAAPDDEVIMLRSLGDEEEPPEIRLLDDDTDHRGNGRARPAIARAVSMRTHRPPAPARAPEPPPTWTIAPGDHLWHVADSTLRSSWQRAPTDAEVAQYWQQLVEHNRDRLAVRDDPDLVYPGQVFELPPVPGPATT